MQRHFDVSSFCASHRDVDLYTVSQQRKDAANGQVALLNVQPRHPKVEMGCDGNTKNWWLSCALELSPGVVKPDVLCNATAEHDPCAERYIDLFKPTVQNTKNLVQRQRLLLRDKIDHDGHCFVIKKTTTANDWSDWWALSIKIQVAMKPFVFRRRDDSLAK